MTNTELVEALRKRSLSYSQFAEMLGVTQPAVTYWVQGKNPVPEVAAIALAVYDHKQQRVVSKCLQSATEALRAMVA